MSLQKINKKILNNRAGCPATLQGANAIISLNFKFNLKKFNLEKVVQKE